MERRENDGVMGGREIDGQTDGKVWTEPGEEHRWRMNHVTLCNRIGTPLNKPNTSPDHCLNSVLWDYGPIPNKPLSPHPRHFEYIGMDGKDKQYG